tara:strand:+ start:376 stop:564 length:189 start_codon:yes stop_codon:yes gene_type:complete
MKTILVIFTALLLTACSISEPRLSFGKKCTVSEDKIVYSYLWVYDKSAGIPADAISCELLDK